MVAVTMACRSTSVGDRLRAVRTLHEALHYRELIAAFDDPVVNGLETLLLMVRDKAMLLWSPCAFSLIETISYYMLHVISRDFQKTLSCENAICLSFKVKSK